jgi:histone H3/H4
MTDVETPETLPAKKKIIRGKKLPRTEEESQSQSQAHVKEEIHLEDEPIKTSEQHEKENAKEEEGEEEADNSGQDTDVDAKETHADTKTEAPVKPAKAPKAQKAKKPTTKKTKEPAKPKGKPKAVPKVEKAKPKPKERIKKVTTPKARALKNKKTGESSKAVDMKGTKRRRDRTAIFRDIIKLRKERRNLIRKAPMQRLIREISVEFCLDAKTKSGLRFQRKAFLILQLATEALMTDIAETCTELMAYKERKTLDFSTLYVALRMHPLKDMFHEKCSRLRILAEQEKFKRSSTARTAYFKRLEDAKTGEKPQGSKKRKPAATLKRSKDDQPEEPVVMKKGKIIKRTPTEIPV